MSYIPENQLTFEETQKLSPTELVEYCMQQGSILLKKAELNRQLRYEKEQKSLKK